VKFADNLNKKFVNFFFQTLQGFLDLFDKSELALVGEVRDNVEFLSNSIGIESLELQPK
jgi:hypothetical protein